ncbi:MAG: class E sortase, partial [Ornithinibacter sp.]
MRLRRLIGWVGELLVTAGVLLLLFTAWQLWWTDVTSNRVQDATVTMLEQNFQARPTKAPTPSAVPKELRSGKAFAIVRIPRFGTDYARPVLEGSGRDILEEGVGHYADTALPGEVGNFAMAGHRTTYGRPFHDIDTIAVGDRVVIETATDFFVYQVSGSEIVLPTDVEVIAPVPGEPAATPLTAVMTMTSCHPKYSATERFIVHGTLVQTVPRAQWDP